ncbi:hypothetical protein FGU65_12595 [Methanoculleus sp. FWC-SCC1]|uniref:Uncharacterized protein n=1 Tax=Methanoculleus frigidifontis TaxID=2584085 RepID=A0ABT8MCR8_9EURY|nr:hypothetical protein [Methanoculleus sp. FWC-SCC1]MDN7025709.1 hypothetical protein [Methanoculleus sp. FWC-SCC1]
MVGTPEWMQRRMGLRRHRGCRRPGAAGYIEVPLGRDTLRALKKGLRGIRFGRVPRLGEIVAALDHAWLAAERAPES